MILQSSTYSSAPADTRVLFLAVYSPLTLNNQKEVSLIYLHLAASNYERHKIFCSPPSCIVWNSHLHLTVYKNMPDCSNFVTDKYGKNLFLNLFISNQDTFLSYELM